MLYCMLAALALADPFYLIQTRTAPLKVMPDAVQHRVAKYYGYVRPTTTLGLEAIAIPESFKTLVREYREYNQEDNALLASDADFYWTDSAFLPPPHKRGMTVGSSVLITKRIPYLPIDVYVHELVHVYQNKKYNRFVFATCYLISPVLQALLGVARIKYSFIQSMEDQATSVQERFWYWLVQRYANTQASAIQK
ncbi:MAG: hypothetical protein WC551_08830 [Patescibacteria group bacterium]